MLTKNYCDFETCVALKEFGCSVNNECFQSKIVSKEIPLKFFDTTLQGTSLEYAPIISLYEAQKWLREEKGILLQPVYLELSDEWICVIRDKNKRYAYSTQKQKNYEEALAEGIKEAIKILKEE